jgi:hypothetical protein
MIDFLVRLLESGVSEDDFEPPPMTIDVEFVQDSENAQTGLWPDDLEPVDRFPSPTTS